MAMTACLSPRHRRRKAEEADFNERLTALKQEARSKAPQVG
jgi:hypothetical protein